MAAIVIPAVFPTTLSSTDPVCAAESARLLADRIVELRQQMALLLGLPLDTPISDPLNFGSGLMGTRRQRSRNTDTTHFRLDADQVMTMSPSPGFVVHTNPAAITNDINLAGPIINGRDQVGAFAANSFVHMYWIYNGTTLASLSSLAAPYPGPGPVLPSGYSLGAYAGAILLDGSSQIVNCRIQGRWTLFQAERQVAPATTYTTGSLQSVSLSSCVPSNAESVRFGVNLGVVGSTLAANTYTARMFDGADDFAGQVTVVTDLDTGDGANYGVFHALQTSQILKITVAAGGINTPTATVYVIGFENANVG